MNNLQLQFRTYDLALSTALVSQGFSVDSFEKQPNSNNKICFIFNHSNNIDNVVQLYWTDQLLVNPKYYFDILKHLKTRMYEVK